MKKIIAITVVVLTVLSCNRIAKEERVLVKKADDAVLKIATPKAKCLKCQKIIETGLETINGVHQSILDLNEKHVSIVYNPNHTSPEALSAAVAELTTKTPCK
jgi:copper chaperone CopZ